ncbi:MAG: CoA transferase [Chloroflexi bacterium]|nr:CoA transferase [Chloroflexota bacterium]
MKPLAGIRVLDLSRLLPGPYATMLLADLGAEVIKIESPMLGDYVRLTPPFITQPETGATISGHFVMLNRNKKSVALNFRNARGKEIFLRLARDADILIESYRAGATDKWGIGYAMLRAINPRLVYCSLSGYGQSGPYANRAGHDLNYLALSGLLAANGTVHAPVPPVVQIADLSGGMLAAIGCLAAIVQRAQTGAGMFLDISLFDGALSWAGAVLGAAHAAGKKIARGKMELNGGMACYNVYATRDDQFITFAAIEPNFWNAFCQAVAREDLIARAYEYDAVAEVAAIFKTKSRAEWLTFFETIDACIEPVREFSDVFSDPHIRHRQLISELNVPGFGKIPQVGSVFVFGEKNSAPPPQLGEHTREVLQKLALDDAEIERLEKAGVIKTLATREKKE